MEKEYIKILKQQLKSATQDSMNYKKRIDEAIKYIESLQNSEVFRLSRTSEAFDNLDKETAVRNEVTLTMIK